MDFLHLHSSRLSYSELQEESVLIFSSEDIKLWQAWKDLLQKWIFNQKELFQS